MTFCVFCGSGLRPTERTKEHILPMWLLKFTGDPHRKIRLGFDIETGKEIIRPASTFHFPACDSCNQKYGKKLETRAAKIVESMSHKQTISVSETYVFLDWLDKVRIGMWLAFYMLRREKNFQPKFHIDTRLGHKDRIAIVSIDASDATKQLSFGGFDNELFHTSQCALYLRINNIKIISASFDYLVSQEAGLPFADENFLHRNSGFVASNLKPGSHRLKRDWGIFGKLQTTILAQPIIDTRFSDVARASNIYFDSRILQHSKKSIFVRNPRDFLRIMPLKVIANSASGFSYRSKRTERIKIKKSILHTDAAFMHNLYAIMLDRILRAFPYRIQNKDGSTSTSIDRFYSYCEAGYQIIARMQSMNAPVGPTNELIEELQRLSRVIEERDAYLLGSCTSQITR